MDCKNCGKQNTADAKFCVNCGTSLNSVQTFDEQNIFGDEQYSNDKVIADNPFGSEYGSIKITNADLNNTVVQNRNFNPYAYTANHSQRKSWSKFVFVSTMIMCIWGFLLFANLAVSASLINSPIVVPESAIDGEMPSVFLAYKISNIFGSFFSLMLVISLFTVTILSRKLQKSAIMGVDVKSRLKSTKIVLFLFIFELVFLIVMMVISYIYTHAQYNLAKELLSLGWTPDDIKNTLGILFDNSNTEGLNAVVVAVTFVIFQYLWMLILSVIGLYKVIGVINFLKTQE
ncbi:MAG: zinc ribbon domain-containing protein [Clostridiales bacterium]|nr:zinc ribbon domain-containing protein [Clostridiales bacterium]